MQHLCEMALGVFTSVGVTKAHLPPFERVGDLLEYLLDDLEFIAKEKGDVGQLLYDKYCKLYKALPQKCQKQTQAA